MNLFFSLYYKFTTVVSDEILFQEKERQKTLRVHEKTTYATRVNAKTASMRRAALDTEDDDDQARKIKDDPGWIMAVTRGPFLTFSAEILLLVLLNDIL